MKTEKYVLAVLTFFTIFILSSAVLKGRTLRPFQEVCEIQTVVSNEKLRIPSNKHLEDVEVLCLLVL